MPLDTTVRLDGIDRVYATLGRVEGNKILRVPTEQGVILLVGEMKPYPPPIPHQKYVRTKTLGKGWTKRVTAQGGGIVGVVGNKVEYAPRVQNAYMQERFFKNRWQTDKSVMDKCRERIVGFFQAAIARALRG